MSIWTTSYSAKYAVIWCQGRAACGSKEGAVLLVPRDLAANSDAGVSAGQSHAIEAIVAERGSASDDREPLSSSARECVAETRSSLLLKKWDDIRRMVTVAAHVTTNPDYPMENMCSRPRQFQNCLASSAACFFPSSIMSTARPSQVCSTVIAVILRTPIKWSQNSMYLVTYSKLGGGSL